MKRTTDDRFSPVPWALLVLLAVLLAGLGLLRLCAAADDAPVVTPSPSPAATPTPTPDAAELLLAGMTTEEKLCQLLIVHPEALTGSRVTAESEALRAALEAYPVGGVLLDTGNMKTREQLTALNAFFSDRGMLITVDEEGGRVARVMSTVGTTWLNNMFSYRSGGEETAYQNALTLAADLRGCGFNVDLAPVADVWSNPKNTVIGNRAYSDDYDEAATLIGAAVRGFADGELICCLKHFPGHGSTRADSHEQAAIVEKTEEQLLAEDLKPFRSGIEAGAEMVMVGHLTVPTMDDQPASESRAITTGLLRETLGFDGVVITDGLQMAAAGQLSDGEKALRCLNAGADLLLEIQDIPGTIEALQAALADGTLAPERLDESVLRILRLKLAHGIL